MTMLELFIAIWSGLLVGSIPILLVLWHKDVCRFYVFWFGMGVELFLIKQILVFAIELSSHSTLNEVLTLTGLGFIATGVIKSLFRDFRVPLTDRKKF